MPTITLKNVPPGLHRQLKDRATRNFRSLNSEILASLTDSLARPERDSEQALADARALRAKLAAQGVWLTEDDLRQAKEAGRR